MTLRRILAATLLMSAPLPALAAEGYDFDTLAACSVIYQEMSTLYGERGDAQQQADFLDTALAFSASAFLVLDGPGVDPGDAATYANERMKVVSESLNESAAAKEDGDMGVITEWLPYCDTLGAGVGQLIARTYQNP